MKTKIKKFFINAGLVVFTILLVCVLFRVWWLGLGDSKYANGLLPIALTVIGFLAFVLREKARWAYGFVELILGLVTTEQGVPKVWTDFHHYIQSTDFLKTAAGLYFIVRAWDNIGKALSAHKKKKDKKISDYEVLIRGRAYEIWLRNGKPLGEANAHWATARKEIEGDTSLPKAPKIGEVYHIAKWWASTFKA